VVERYDTGRMEAFSDGVFAIAITLLVLEISVPEEDFDNLLRGILDQWPSYLAYATSFLTIGTAWFLHHGIFRRMRHADHNVARLNLFLLMVVAFLPFPTRLVAEAADASDAERTAVLFYGAVLVVMLMLLAALGRYAASQPKLLHEGARASDLDAMANQITPGLASFAVALGIAAAAPRVAAIGYLVIALVAVPSVRVDKLG
jgi:uncharacterized membrane protein